MVLNEEFGAYTWNKIVLSSPKWPKYKEPDWNIIRKLALRRKWWFGEVGRSYWTDTSYLYCNELSLFNTRAAHCGRCRPVSPYRFSPFLHSKRTCSSKLSKHPLRTENTFPVPPRQLGLSMCLNSGQWNKHGNMWQFLEISLKRPLSFILCLPYPLSFSSILQISIWWRRHNQHSRPWG